MITLSEYYELRPWIRLILGVIYDLKYADTVDDWSIKAAYVMADTHLTELEQYPGSIDRKEKDKI